MFTELAGAEAKGVASSDVWLDWDLSAIVPAGAKYVLMNFYNTSGYDNIGNAGARENGSALGRYITTVVDEHFAAYGAINMLVKVDVNRVVEIRASQTGRFKFNIKGYWS